MGQRDHGSSGSGRVESDATPASDSNNLIHAIFDNTAALVVVLDNEGRIVRFNPAAERLSGCLFSDIEGRHPWEIYIPPEDAAANRHQTFELLAGDSVQTQSIDCWTSENGGRHFIEWSNSVLRDENGKVEYLVSVGTDTTVRKLIEDTTRESEARFWTLFENAPEAVVVLDTEKMRFVDANQNACLLFKMDREDLINQGPVDLSPPLQPDGRDSAQAAIGVINQALAGTVQHFEWMHRDATGEDIPCEVYLVRLPSATRKILRGSIVDIRARKQVEEALRASEEKYRELFENMTSGFALHEIICDDSGKPVDYRYLEVNPAFEKLTGISAETILGRTIREVIPNIEDYWIQVFGEVALTGQPIAYENDAGGLSRTYDTWVFSPRKNQFAVIFNDISQRKLAEAKLIESEKIHRAMIEASPDAVATTNRYAVITLASPRFVEIFRLNSAADAIGTSIKDWVAEEDRDRAMANMQKRLAGEQLGPVEYRLLRRDGSFFYAEANVSVMRDESGEAEGAVSFIRDISERKKAEKERLELERQIQHSQKLESLGVLAGGIAHDFNNLLTGILGYSDLALKLLDKRSQVADYIYQVVIGAKKAAELTQQMLAYSGKGRFNVQPVDLTELVRDMEGLLKISISKKCRLEYRLVSGLPAFEADAAQIRQIVMNLIINASEAIGDGQGTIAISTGEMYCEEDYLKKHYMGQNIPAGRYIFLEISDTGYGISRETIKKIFDPFFTTKFTGRGLGLAAVLGIIRGHGGTIRVYSEVNKGTTFKVLFPVSKQPVAAQAAAENTGDDGWRGEGKVLIVDDEASVRSLAGTMLETMGFNVLTASDGEQGVELFRRHDNDIRLVLLDMTMPKMDGEETLNAIRAIRHDAKIILSSGYNQQSMIERFTGSALSGFIQKPYSYDDLVAVVRDVLDE